MRKLGREGKEERMSRGEKKERGKGAHCRGEGGGWGETQEKEKHAVPGAAVQLGGCL